MVRLEVLGRRFQRRLGLDRARWLGSASQLLGRTLRVFVVGPGVAGGLAAAREKDSSGSGQT